MKSKGGRPKTLKDSKLVTIRLPAKMIEKLKEKGNYSEIIRALITEHLRELNGVDLQ